MIDTLPLCGPRFGACLALRGIGFAALLALTAPSQAQSVGSTPTPVPEAVMDTIVVKGQALRRQNNAYSTTTLGTEDIRLRGVSNVEQMFREVPGMNVQDFQLGGVASSTVIRGFGGGGHGGDLGLVVDGIPLNEANSHADGYVDTSVLVPLEIRDLTVYRGPISALYGNFNRGGLVSIETRKSGDYLEGDIVAAATDGTLDAQAVLGRPVGQSGQLNAAIQGYRTDGFRAQSKAERLVGAARYGWSATEKLKLSVAGRAYSGDADSAAYVPAAQFAIDPYGIDPRVQNDGAEKGFSTLRFDAGYAVGDDTELLAFVYGTEQDFTRWFSRGPQDAAAAWRQREETYDRTVYGYGTSLNGRLRFAARDVDYVVGIEGFDESTDFEFYDDLDNRQRTSAAQNNRESTLESTSVFAETNIALSRIFSASLGARYNSFTGDCRLLGPETGSDPCDRLSRIDDLSPKLGLRAQVYSALLLRASVSEGFALPNGFAKFAPGAQSLEPNELRQWEVGAAWNPVPQIDADLALYRINSTQEIVSPAPGEFENFGETLRDGAELNIGWRPLAGLELRAIASRTDSEVEQNRDAALLGNQVTGVPKETLTFITAWQPTPLIELTALYRHVGEYFIDASNTVTAPSYRVVDLIASYDLPRSDRMRLRLFVDNLFDVVYATTVNSLGFAPGAPQTVRVGLQFDL
jgi:iron complex outermembrane recepter protein